MNTVPKSLLRNIIKLNTVYMTNEGLFIFFKQQSVAGIGDSIFDGVKITVNYFTQLKGYIIGNPNTYSEDLSGLRKNSYYNFIEAIFRWENE